MLSYAMRVWATLLVRPEFLFDVQKAKHVEPCLNVIKQVFIDCFHATKISKVRQMFILWEKYYY